MSIQTSTLRPGLLVSLKTSVVGNVSYARKDIEREHKIEGGALKAKWETERTVTDPVEHEAAQTVRNKISNMIRGCCAASAFGLLCPESDAAELATAIRESYQLADEFNTQAKLTRIRVYAMAGKIAADDVEATKAIAREMRELMDDMANGIANLDVEAVREAATQADKVATMLSPEMQARVGIAIDTARKTATKINKAGERAAQEIDKRAIRKITEQRTAFLDLDGSADVVAPTEQGRAIDFEPQVDVSKAERKAYGRPPVQSVDMDRYEEMGRLQDRLDTLEAGLSVPKLELE